ncbi:DUF454 family protein [Liberiplasma polymorphum]|jgi:uncharacterized protein|uniref:DUF454 family protein n=1 Tax=Liberiplasma polymorphum TaxID=3374570 RepID=UPI003771BDF2
MLKAVYIFLGSLFLALGMIGVVLPLLPTTPFLLLTAYFYAKGSKKFHDWFLRTWIYKKYLEDFITTRAMTLKQKLTLLLFVDFMLLFPFIILEYVWVKPLIIILVITKYVYFFTAVKTIRLEKNT